MTHTKWRSDGHPTGLINKGSLLSSPTASWIDGNADSGIRACLAEEFSSIHVLHLRGNARTSGERSRPKGGKVFGGGSRAPVAITIFVKNPDATHEGCKIHYRDIGDYLTREQKLEALTEAVSIKGIQRLASNHAKYSITIGLDQRSEAFAQFYPLGSEDAKAGKADDAIFRLYSALGLVTTGRDRIHLQLLTMMLVPKMHERMTQDYLAALSELESKILNLRWM